MGKFGLGKKDDGEDSNRLALFGGRKSKSPNPQTTNPYANLPSTSDAYSSAKAKAGVPGYAQKAPSPAPPQQGGYGGMNGGYSDDKKESYGDMGRNTPRNGGGYGSEKYGIHGGYGADKYSGTGDSQSGAGGLRPGGYGGMGRTPSYATEDGRDALFGGAKERVEGRATQQMGYGQPPPYEDGQPPDSGPSYEAYGDRQLTAEEEEEEDVVGEERHWKVWSADLLTYA